MAWQGTSPERTRGRRWMAIRKRILARDPTCRECRKHGRTALAIVVDHVKGLAEGGTDDEDNLQGLCGDCHDAKTAAEAARAQGRPPPRVKGCDADGNPLDPDHAWNRPRLGDDLGT